MNEIQSKLNDIQTMLNGLYDGGDVTEAARSSLQYTLNEAQKVVKNITYEPVLAVVSDDEIKERAKARTTFPVTAYPNKQFEAAAENKWIEGAEWMREKLQRNYR